MAQGQDGLVGLGGKEKKDSLMTSLRSHPPKTIGSLTITEMRDYLAGTITDVATGAVTGTGA